MATTARFEQDDLDKEALLRQLGAPTLGLGAGGANPGDVGRAASDETDNPANYDRSGGTHDAVDPILPPTVGGQTPDVSNTMPVPPPTLTGDNQAHEVPSAMPPVPSGKPYTGFTPKYAMEGFNYGREQDPGKSAKDAFAMLANQAPPPPLNDKAALGEWFKQYIQPGMDALGHKVSSVNGDTFSYANPEGAYTIDYGRGAGAEGGALAWQAQDPTAGQGPGGARTNPLAPASGGDFGGDNFARPAPSQPGQDPGPWQSSYVPFNPQAEIQKEIEAAMKGGQSPMDAEALMKLLQGGQV